MWPAQAAPIFVTVEGSRSTDSEKASLAEMFRDWGLSTPDALRAGSERVAFSSVDRLRRHSSRDRCSQGH